jgi:hypothetical protein
MPKNTKKKSKEEKWVHAYLGVVDGAFTTSNVCAQALRSPGSLLQFVGHEFNFLTNDGF